MLYRPEADEIKESVDYFHLPKRIGSVPAATLLDIAKDNAELAATIENPAKLRFVEVAGSAYLEAALVSADPGEDVDERLELVDRGIAYLQQASSAEYRLLERGYRDPDDQTDWRRIELMIAFDQVYRDILCGEVTNATKQELLTELDQHYRYASMLFKHTSFSSDARGLQQEIRVLRQSWEQYQQEGDPITFPSTVRGGNGHILPNETHDIVVAIMNDQKVEFETVEVKSANVKRNYKDLTRYASRLAFVNKDGQVRWLDKVPA